MGINVKHYCNAGLRFVLHFVKLPTSWQAIWGCKCLELLGKMKNDRFLVFCLFRSSEREGGCVIDRQQGGNRGTKEGQRVGNGRRERERESERFYILNL